ncbi:unnamed protein product [Lathyrus oleraceus]|uniref:Erythronate-4-phosphate dehydrogenase family protein n=1 Tax=Pisum sativum TaxID=3888 RepID=A0A9D4XIU4_PEA|nr:uncharacterized protein At1g01500 [Pisum sativum]KAI5421844.1 hypothetical protein KIW84_045328 [Pisum sativum]
MDQNEEAIAKSENSLSFSPIKSHRSWLELRLFYVRISPCVINSAPECLTLCHPNRETGSSLVINGTPIPAIDSAPPLPLRRDRVDKESAEVTYVSTDNVRITGGAEFEVYEKDVLFLCGSLERLDTDWGNGSGWEMDCHVAAGSIGSGSSAFFRPKLGVSAPSVEVYVAGCCSGVPVILSKTISMSPRRRVPRHAILDAIPEDEEINVIEKDHAKSMNGLIPHPKLQITGSPGSEVYDYDLDGKMANGFYSQEMYLGEDGQLTWFNAGVRVGVGIGLGMCVGIGIGVGLLMRSYQTTTKNFRRKFF